MELPTATTPVHTLDEDATPSRHGALSFLRAILPFVRPFKKSAFVLLFGIFLEMSFEQFQRLSFTMLIDHAITPQDYRLLVILLAALAVGALVVYGLVFLLDWVWAHFGADVMNHLRRCLFERLQQLSHGYHVRASSGELAARFTTDLPAIEAAVTVALPAGITAFCCAVTSVPLLFTLEWRLALLSVLGLPLCFLGQKWLGPRAVEASYAQKTEEAGLLGAVQESLGAQAVIRAFGLEASTMSAFDARLASLRARVVRSQYLYYLQQRVPNVTALLVHLTILGIGAWLAFQGALKVGELVSFNVLFLAASGAVTSFAWVVPYLTEAAAGMARLRQVLDEPPSVVDAADAPPRAPLEREVALEGVTFSHDGERPVLQALTLRIPRGAQVAIVGPSGCGKSSVLSLLMRFHDPAEGRVTIDGKDLREVTQASHRARIGLVFQESILFDATVRENIRVGRPTATDAEVEAAARAAELHDAVAVLPGGYAMRVGERGGKLSGGQRQRVAIARALLRDPELLLLDEATSALDPATEDALNATLARVAQGRTVVSVTHRLASAVKADRIFVLSGGKVVEEGRHDELVQRRGVYARLWEKQSGFVQKRPGGPMTVSINRLHALTMLSTLDDGQLEALSRGFECEQVAAGATIFEAGARGTKFYMIARGKVGVFRADDRGEEERVAVLADGDHFGEVALLHDAPRNATVRALAPCTLLSLDRAEFAALLDSSPRLRDAVEKAAERRSDRLPRAVG